MNVLILGSGGREHAFAWKISQSKNLQNLYIAPGNAGTANCGTNVNISVTDFEAIKNLVWEKEYNFANSTGSPASRIFSKLMPFTVRPSLISRQGMMRLQSKVQRLRFKVTSSSNAMVSS